MPRDDGDKDNLSPSLVKLGRSLAAASSSSVDLAKVHKLCIITLLRILDNILLDINTLPERKNARIRKIKTTGPFHDRAGQWEGSIDFLLECGFERTSDIQLKIVDESISRLLFGRRELVQFAVEKLGLLESKLPDCPAVDIISTAISSASRTDEDDTVHEAAIDQCAHSDGSALDDNRCSSQERISGSMNAVMSPNSIPNNGSVLATMDTNEEGGQQIILQPSEDENTPTYHQHQYQQLCQKKQEDEQLPSKQLSQEPEAQHIQNDMASSPKSSSESMSSLLEEIEMELQGDTSFFLDDYTREHTPDEMLGDGEVASLSPTINVQLPLDDDFPASGCFVAEFSQEEENDDSLSARHSDPNAPLLTIDNRVRLKQTKHIEVENEVKDIATIESVSDANENTAANIDRIIGPITIDDHNELKHSGMVEEILLMQSPDTYTPSSGVFRGHDDDFCNTSQTITINDGTVDVTHLNGCNVTEPNSIVNFDPENEMLNEVDNAHTAPSLHVQQAERTSEDLNDENHPQLDNMPDIDMNSDGQQTPDFGDDTDSTPIRSLPITSSPPDYDDDSPDDYINLFDQISIPEGEFSSTNDNYDVIQYRHGFELCHSALFSIWFDMAVGRPGGNHKSRDRPIYTDPSAGLTNLVLHKRRQVETESTNEDKSSLTCDSSKRPIILVPLDVAYASWACILKLNSDDDRAVQDPATSDDGSAAGKLYCWIVSNHRQLSVIDDNIPPAEETIISKHDRNLFVDVCNFVCRSLRDVGLISLYSATILGGVSDDSTLYIGVKEWIKFKKHMPLTRDDTTAKLDDRALLSKCHGVLSRLVYPKILREVEILNKNDLSRGSTNHDLICWYSCQWAVNHLIESGQFMIAKSLLSNILFIQLRLQYMGCLAGTYAHCRDCARLAFCQPQSQSSDLNTKDSKLGTNDHFEILCSISSELRRSESELSSSVGLDRLEANQLKNDIGQAMQIIGEFIGDIGPYSVQEMEHYEEAFRLLSEAHGDDQNHKSIADVLFVIGCHHQRFNHFNFAQKCYEQSLRIYKVTIGSEHHCVAQVLHNIGIIYQATTNYDIALKCFKKSLSIRLSQRSENQLLVADSYCWIGKIHREEKRFSKARDSFVAAHKIKVAILGAGHIDSAEVLHNIGIVCDDLGLTSQSLSCFRKVLFIRLANVAGDNDVIGINDVCETLNCIANVYRAKGERQKACLFFEQCLKRRVRIMNAALPDVGQVMLLIQTYEDVIALSKSHANENTRDSNQIRKLGTLFVELGKLYDSQLNKQSKALNYFQHALQIFKEGNDYKLIGNTLSLIGVIHVKKSAHSKALKCFNDSLVMLKMYSETKESSDIADALHNIGNCDARMGHFENSVPAFEEALRIKKLIYPAVHLSISKTEHCLGLVLSQLGSLDEGHKLFKSSLNTRRALLGNDHLDVSFSLHSLGKIYFFQGQVDDAISCLEEALKIKRSKLPDNHMSLAETLHLLGSLYIKKGTFAPAIPLLNSALIAYRGRVDCEIIKSDVLDLLGCAYAKIGDTDDAILSYEHSLKIKKSVVGEVTIPCANVLMEIGRLKSFKKDDDGALAAFKEVKIIHKMVYDKNHLKNADLLIQVGLIQERLDNDDIALRCFVEALKIRRKLLDSNHRDIAAAIVYVGRMHQGRGDHVKAIPFFHDAIKIYQESDGDIASYEYGSASRLLGLSQIAIGESDSAIESLEFCLDGRASTFGTESKEWAEAAYSLGVAKSEVGLHDDAIPLFEKFVILQKGFVESDLPSVADSLLSLGRIYVHKRKVENAMACFDEALGFMKQSNNDQGASEVLFQIGNVRESKKQYHESLVCYEESLKLRVSAVGEDEVTADIVSRIGELHRMRGQYDIALEKFSLALDMYKCAVGETHLSVANTYHSLGYVCDAMDDVPKSMQNHKEGLSVRKLILGGNHVLLASSLDDIAGMYQKQNEHQKALKCLKEALRIRRLQLRDDDIEISKTLFGMGIIFAAINDNENAAECYKTSYEISSRVDSHPKLEAQTLHQIGCLEAAKGNYREALHNWRTSLSKYRESGLRDDHYMVACTLGNIEMAENVLRT